MSMIALFAAASSLAILSAPSALALSLGTPLPAHPYDLETNPHVNPVNVTLGNAHLPSHNQRRNCLTYSDPAQNTVGALQSIYYNSAGYYNGGSAWTDVNGVEDMMNLMLFRGETTWDAVPAAVINHYDSQFVNGGSYDDLGWAVLASVKQCDYNAAHGRETTTCINRAVKYYNIIVGAWDTTKCNGGVWWSSARDYKNAITNELFLFTSGALYLRTGQASLLNNAKLAWNWLNASGMRNSQGLYNDGLTSSCTNNGQTTWTYNQIVVASGLASLYVATGDASYLTAAEVSIDATIAHMETNRILRESCDDVAANGAKCDADQQLFKGIFTKHLQYYLDMANNAARTAKYAGFLESQASGVVHYATGAGYNVGSVWYGGDQGGSVHSPKAQSSGAAALIAAAKYAAGGAC